MLVNYDPVKCLDNLTFFEHVRTHPDLFERIWTGQASPSKADIQQTLQEVAKAANIFLNKESTLKSKALWILLQVRRAQQRNQEVYEDGPL